MENMETDIVEDEVELEDEYKSAIPSNLITKSIRKCYARRMRLPGVLLLVLILIWYVFPFSNIVFPMQVDAEDDFTSILNSNTRCVETTLNGLYFTGYTSTIFERPNGYYYYTVRDGCILIVLLSPATCNEGISNMESVTIKAKVCTPGQSYDRLLFNLSSDLSKMPSDISNIAPEYNLTTEGFMSLMEVVYLDEVAVTGLSTRILICLYILCMIITLYAFLTNFMFALFPNIAPPVLTLARFGNRKKLLAKAEHELSTLPQLATEDMFITKSFFIEISNEGVAIVPIDEIIWVYKHSTLHKFLWYNFVISYTLHIHGNKHYYIRCPKNIKSDIDGIMDYLAEANHSILVGFNEENRIKAQKIQNKKALHLNKLFEFMKRRI